MPWFTFFGLLDNLLTWVHDKNLDCNALKLAITNFFANQNDNASAKV